MRKRIILGVAAVGIALAFVFSFAESEKSKEEQKGKDDLFRQVKLFADALAIVQNDYVDEVTNKDLIYGALRGMLSSLDAHSQFLDPDSFNELRVDTEGQFGGLGIEITIKDGLLTVVTPIEDTPAWKAGLQSNDRIVKIDNDITRDMPLSEAVKRLRGKPGEAVTLVILRESERKVLDFKIVRDIIKVKDIKEARILDDGVAYIRLVEFREHTPEDLDAALAKLKQDGMTALILDLRNNPGGLLDVAVKVVARFIEKDKLVVYTQGRKGSKQNKFMSDYKDPLLEVPIAVLINEGSASGSEIVAGALQDYKRAIIVGKKSFGKGSVQTIIPLSDGSALRLTTSKYFTPSGKVIHGNGVTPDISVEEAKIQLAKKDSAVESKAEEVFDTLSQKEKPGQEQTETFKDYKQDNQLMHAVDVLKAVRIFRK
jgi:carboxyl-terminal processing protease